LAAPACIEPVEQEGHGMRIESTAYANMPSIDIPSMETVCFHDSVSQPAMAKPASFVATASSPVVDEEPTTDLDFINTSWSASPCSMQAGVIPSSPGEFMQLMTKPLQPTALESSPVHWRCSRWSYSTSATLRLSSCLAKKSKSHIPAGTAVQNLLMRKLGLSTGEHIKSEDFDHYLKAVKEGLKDEDVILI
jgi:hypothetical protein